MRALLLLTTRPTSTRRSMTLATCPLIFGNFVCNICCVLRGFSLINSSASFCFGPDYYSITSLLIEKPQPIPAEIFLELLPVFASRIQLAILTAYKLLHEEYCLCHASCILEDAHWWKASSNNGAKSQWSNRLIVRILQWSIDYLQFDRSAFQLTSIFLRGDGSYAARLFK